MEILHRAAKEVRPGFEFILSDESLDRHGTIIHSDGWDLSNFRKNNIAFFNHDQDFPIGTWENVRIEGKKLIGKLKLAQEGTSDRIDEIIRLISQKILKAVSIGFKPLARPDIIDDVPHYKKVQLLEASVVGVGSNPNALAMARSLGISPEVERLVFGKIADDNTADQSRGPPRSKIAALPTTPGKPKQMKTIAERIQAAEEKLTEIRAQLDEHLEQSGDEPDEAALTVLEELNGKMATAQRTVETLKMAEQQLAARAIQVAEARGEETQQQSQRRPFARAAEQVKPAEFVMRSLVGAVLSRATKRPINEILAERYGEDGKIDERLALVSSVVNRSKGLHWEDVINRAIGQQVRAATAPATTTTSGWASQLVETSVQGFMELLMPASVYPGLAARGLQLRFGRTGVISVPTRLATPTIAGSFVAEGAPIPVRQGAFSSQSFTPKKMAVISSWTREIAEHSTPAIEGLIRSAIQEDTSVALDSVLLDATAASAIRPAGIRNGVTVTTAVAGGGFAALVGDIKALATALITASNGNLRAPTWIMNPIQQLSIAMTQNAGGDFPFAAEINANRLQGYPAILSANVTAGMLILVDAADFVVIEGDAPRFDLSDQAVLVYDDTAPAAVGTTGSPATVGAPARSLWQTDSVAVRMIMDVNWGMRRAGVVAWTQAVTW